MYGTAGRFASGSSPPQTVSTEPTYLRNRGEEKRDRFSEIITDLTMNVLRVTQAEVERKTTLPRHGMPELEALHAEGSEI